MKKIANLQAHSATQHIRVISITTTEWTKKKLQGLIKTMNEDFCLMRFVAQEEIEME